MLCDIEVRWNGFDRPELLSGGTIPPGHFAVHACGDPLDLPLRKECVRARARLSRARGRDTQHRTAWVMKDSFRVSIREVPRRCP